MFSIVPKVPSGAISPKWTKILTGVSIVGVSLLVAPIIAAIIKGMVGMAAAVVIGVLLYKLAPWFSMWSSNFVLKLIKYEARVNPVETMQSVYSERKSATDEAEKQIKIFNAEVNSYETKLEDLRKKFPEDVPRFERHLAAMKTLLNKRYSALAATRVHLEKYYEGIQRADAIWEMTKASDALSKSAGLLSEKDALQRIKADEALKSVEDGMSRSFAELDHLLRTEVQDDEPGTSTYELPRNEPEILIPVSANVFSPTTKEVTPRSFRSKE